VSRPRSTYGKRQREQEKREKAQAKAERRVARHTLDQDETVEPVEASESQLIDELATLHGAFEAGNVPLGEFEERRDNIRTQLERIQP